MIEDNRYEAGKTIVKVLDWLPGPDILRDSTEMLSEGYHALSPTVNSGIAHITAALPSAMFDYINRKKVESDIDKWEPGSDSSELWKRFNSGTRPVEQPKNTTKSNIVVVPRYSSAYEQYANRWVTPTE